MATSVNAAFSEFNKDVVNLVSDKTKVARASRDWLFGQLENLPNKISDFPVLYDGMHIRFGSFARNTKIRPLDDIDMILTFAAQGSTYNMQSYGKSYLIDVPETATNLRKLCDDNGRLNSIRLVNKLVSSLAQIEHYKKAELHRRQEAATLQLTSYEWVFDIVPAFYTDTGYYLIPDGSGGWKATDPRVDQTRVTEINQQHSGAILQIIRTLKYWNRRPIMPTIPSYLFENIILNYYATRSSISDWIDANLIEFWAHLSTAIFGSVLDPKGFQGELNDLSVEDKLKISAKATEANQKGFEAYQFETRDSDQEKAINKWREVFGDEFPEYG
ncbi:MAG TPA: hypothetical protein VGK02_06225 [Candidatus Aquicultor sp.]|jgi:hypothetical protein